MIIFGTYILITFCSLSIFYFLWNRERIVYQLDQKLHTQLCGEIRNDLYKGWAVVAQQAKTDSKSKWMRVVHDLQITNFSRFGYQIPGSDPIELIYSWLATKLMMDNNVVDFSYNNSFRNTMITADTQDLILSTVSTLLCRNEGIASINLNYNKSNNLIELDIKTNNLNKDIPLTENQKNHIFSMNGNFHIEKEKFTLCLPNKK